MNNLKQFQKLSGLFKVAAGVGGVGYLGYNSLFSGYFPMIQQIHLHPVISIESGSNLSFSRNFRNGSWKNEIFKFPSFFCVYLSCTVDGGHRGVVFNRLWGVKDNIYSEGTHFLIPLMEWPIIYDVRTRPTELSSYSGTRDLQYVNMSLRVLYRPEVPYLPAILRKYGTDYDRRVLPSIINETLKAIVAMYNAEQVWRHISTADFILRFRWTL